ncbi:MAG TPA: hypothetical protein VGH38_19665, partial [Bryobacteraceae bacterium]
MKAARILIAGAILTLTLSAQPDDPDAAVRLRKMIFWTAGIGPDPTTADPFADLGEVQTSTPGLAIGSSFARRFFSENLGFRKELMSQFDTTEDGRPASRQSVGFEVLKKFSTSTSTVAAFDFQGRFVRRDGYNPVLDDMEGAGRPGWAFEYHNLYLDLYNIFNPLMGSDARSENVGRFNFRAGRFYVPFGLNLQTDTHGTVLQLTNESNFGFERDWYTGFWGSLNKHLNYDAYYLVGSGYDLQFKGQSGLAALRVSLSNQYSSRYGLEGGVSVLGGERLSMPDADGRRLPLDTRRVGIDGRYRHTAPHGLLTFTTELSGGRDTVNPVLSQLNQAEYLHGSRRWGVAAQYRRIHQDRVGTDSSVIGELTWYFRNDVGNSN